MGVIAMPPLFAHLGRELICVNAKNVTAEEGADQYGLGLFQLPLMVK